MPRNIIIFLHHHEVQVGFVLKNLLPLFYQNSFNTICIEADASHNLTRDMIARAIEAKKQLRSAIEKTFGFSYKQIDKMDFNQLHRCFMTSHLSSIIDFRGVITMNGDLSMMQSLHEAASSGFDIRGIDLNASRMSSTEALLLSDIREQIQFENLRKLNKQGKSCIVLLGANHFSSMRKNVATLPPAEQANYTLTYLHTDSLLAPDLKSEDWYKLRTTPLAKEFTELPAPMHSFNITNSQQQQAFSTWVTQHLGWANASSQSRTKQLIVGGVLALAAGLGIFAYRQFMNNGIDAGPTPKIGSPR